MGRLSLVAALAALLVPAVATARPQPMLGSDLKPAPRLVQDQGLPSSAQTSFSTFSAPPATPRAACGPGSRPAPGIQGRVPPGAPDSGYTCNTELVGHEGHAGGFKVERFVDSSGHQCAYYDTTLLFPIQSLQQLQDRATGVAVVDMTNPAHPVRTETLVTPAMQSPHESLLVNQKRGLLAAVMGNPLAYPGFVDIYDLNPDCRHPVLDSSLPVGLLGHESGFAPDGKTFYATSLFNSNVTAVDVSNPKVPVTLWAANYPSHGMTISDDGNRGYIAGLNIGLEIVDTSQIQARKPGPQVNLISQLTWSSMSIPQVAIPFRSHGKPFLLEVDEFAVSEDGGNSFPAANGPRVGAARVIDISNEKAPKVISDLRLEVNEPQNRAAVGNDPGASSQLQGYAAHYCNVSQENDPSLVACSFIASGLRVFDIRDVFHPREVAYFVAPPSPSPVMGARSDYAMSKPAFDPANHDIWYSDGNSGLYAVHLTNGAWPAPAVAPGGGCVRAASVLVRVPRGLRSVRVSVNGRRVRVRRGRVRVSLRGTHGRTVVVRIAGRTRAGRRIVRTHRYSACARG